MVQPERTALDEPRQAHARDRPRRRWTRSRRGPMTPTYGWSLDFTGSRRLSVVLSLALLMTALGATGVQAAGYDPASDVNSMTSTTDYTGAQAWWAAGYTGKGVDVALIDSGVSPVEGLNTPGKVIYGPDLSLESQAPNLTNLDTFGHGTFMAGLIAGRDAALTAPYEQAPASAYRGMAPDARIVSIKVATADGGTDVSQVIAAIDWVVQHRNDNGMNIRVLNLSYGTNSSQWYGVDPLAFAVEQAWDAGIVVVAAAGNSGYQAKGSSPALANPAFDKRIIAVGASDSMGTATLADDTVPDFSAAAKTGSARAPDFVAPGAHIQGLRVPNSYIDAHVADAAMLDERFMRGSGTSESAAIASGAAALILDKFPHATPDQVKRLLKSGAYDMPTCSNSRQRGVGRAPARAPILSAALPVYVQTDRTGGRRRVARAGPRIGSPDPRRRRPQGRASTSSGSRSTPSPWPSSRPPGAPGPAGRGTAAAGPVPRGPAAAGPAPRGPAAAGRARSWSGSSWSGSSWSGSSWSGSSWSGSSWSGSSWSGSSWSTAGWN